MTSIMPSIIEWDIFRDDFKTASEDEFSEVVLLSQSALKSKFYFKKWLSKTTNSKNTF
jgi:hypothetical protein